MHGYPLLTKRVMAFGLIAVCCQAGSDESPANQSPAKKLSDWQRYFSRQAAAYSIVIDQNKSPQAKVVPDAILRWSRPEMTNRLQHSSDVVFAIRPHWFMLAASQHRHLFQFRSFT